MVPVKMIAVRKWNSLFIVGIVYENLHSYQLNRNKYESMVPDNKELKLQPQPPAIWRHICT